MLEITERVEVEVDENGHHFRIAHETFSTAVFTSIRCFERIFLYLSVIFFTKIIDNTENFSNFVLGYHREYFCFVCFVTTKTTKISLISKFSTIYIIDVGNKNYYRKNNGKGARLSRTHVNRKIPFIIEKTLIFAEKFS